MRLGLRSVLSEDVHCRVLESDCGDDVDVVLFDMDQPAVARAAYSLQARYPQATVIACSSLHPILRVFDHGLVPTDRPLTIASLCATLGATPEV